MSVRTARRRKQIHLGAHFPGVNNTTVWSDPDAGSQIAFESFVHLAQTAERGLFDFFFLAEGLRLREHRGKIHDLDVVGRPDTFTVLAALAAVTEHLGLAGTINTTFNEPYEVARQFATLDHLSDGRAAWNMVTSSERVHQEKTSVAADSWTTPIGTRGPRNSSPPPGGSGTAGNPMPWSPTSTPESTPTPLGSTPSNTTVRNSTSVAWRRCPPARKVIPCCCRRATPAMAGTSAPGTPTPCSRCTDRWRRVSATTPM